MEETRKTLRYFEQQVASIDLKAALRTSRRTRNLSMRRLSAILGVSISYIAKTLENRDIRISLLLALGYHMQTNLLESYVRLLPADVQPTERERQFQLRITEPEKEVTALQEKREWLEKMVMK